MRFMEKQARAWVFQHLRGLFDSWKTHFTTNFQSGRIISETHQTIKIDHYAMMIMNKMLDMFMDADVFIHPRMDGLMVPPGVNPAFNLDAGKEELNRVYDNIETQRTNMTRAMMRMNISARTAFRHRATSFPDFLEPSAIMFDRDIGHGAAQPEIVNPPEIQMEKWVRDQTDSKVVRFGFVVYRLSYSESNEEWAEFLVKFKEGLHSGWEGVVGAEEIKSKAQLGLIDGRGLGIPEGDLAAARR